MPEAYAPLASIAYGELRRQSDEYRADISLRETIEDFYHGGFALQAKAKQYLPKLVGEHPKRHAVRCKSAGYINYFAQIVDYYASALFTQELSVRPAADANKASTPGTEPDDTNEYQQFAKDADRNGHGLNDILHDLVVTALKQRRAWLHVEMPQPLPVQSRAEEDALGLGIPYVFEIPAEQIIDWDYDDDGDLAYAVVHQAKRLKGPPGRRQNLILEEFKIWRKLEAIPDPADVAAGFERDVGRDGINRIVWEKYEVQYAPDKKPLDTDEIALTDSGEVSFQRIPILDLCVPDGLWIGNKLAPLAQEHYQRRTTLNDAENRSMVSVPVAKLGSELGAVGGAMPSEVQQDPNRGTNPIDDFYAKGYTVIGAGDSIEFAEPSGRCYEHVAKRIAELKEEIFRISHQLAASISTGAGSMRRSGQSKSEDRAAEALVLGAIGGIVRRFALMLYETISLGRGDDVEWTAHGLDIFEGRDRTAIVEEAVSVDLVSIPSPTFKKLYKFQLATELEPNMDPATSETVRKEIGDGVDAEQELHDIQHEASKDLALNPPQPMLPAESAPPAKPNPDKPEKQQQPAKTPKAKANAA